MQQSNKIEIQKYLDIFYKFKWHGLVPACVVVVVLTIGSTFLPQVYESKCLVEVDRGSIENPLKKQYEPLPELNEHLAIFMENALKYNILSQVVDEVGADVILENSDSYSLSVLHAKPATSKQASTSPQVDHAQREAIINLLRKRIKFRQQPPRFLAVIYRGRLSDANAKILNSLVSTLIEEKTRTEINQAGQNYEFIKSEMESYRRKLEEAEAKLKEFKEQHISELPTNMNTNLTQLTSNKSELVSCELEAKELTARVQYIEEQLKKQKELIVSEIKREANPMLTVLNQRIVMMEIELTRLRTNYTDLHPRVLELKGQLEDLKRQRDEVQNSKMDSETYQLNPVYQQLAQDKQNAQVRLEVLKNRMANLEKRIEENEEKVRSMPSQEQQLLTLTRNYEVTSNIYNMFVQKLEEVRVQEKLATEEADKESFRVLEYARATFLPVAPNRLQLLMIITMVGFGSAVGIMALMNFLDDSFKNVDEAKEFIKKPLLGTVPSLTADGKNGRFVLSKKLLKIIGKS